MSSKPEYKPYDSAGNKYGEPRLNPDWNKPKSVNMPLSKFDLSSKGSSTLPTTSDSEAEELHRVLLENAIYTGTRTDPETAILAWHQRSLAQAEIKGRLKEVVHVGGKAARLLLNRSSDPFDAQTLLDDCALREHELKAQLKAAENTDANN